MQKTKKLLLIPVGVLMIFIMSFSLQQADNYVKLTNHQRKKVPFIISKTKIEWVNGYVNLSALSTTGEIVQINQIPESALKTSTFRSSKINLLLISNNKPYKPIGSHRPLVEITCKKAQPGEPISVVAQGKIYHQKAWYLVDVKLSGTLPKQQFKSTLKSNK